MTNTINKQEPTAGELVVIDDKSHKLHETHFGLMALPHKADPSKVESVCLHDLPLIPIALFYQVVNWQREMAKQHKCEAHTSLFLIGGEWVAEPFHQENTTGSMTIDVSMKTQSAGASSRSASSQASPRMG